MDSAQVMQGILESLGWAILHSFWQMALIWLAYQVLFGTHRKISPLVRHHAAVAAMFIGTAWFIATFIEQYHVYVSIERYLALVPETSAQASPLAAATMSVNNFYKATCKSTPFGLKDCSLQDRTCSNRWRNWQGNCPFPSRCGST